MPNVVAIIQARMRSTRLPGKVLADIEGMPMLARLVPRVRMAESLNSVIVATTLNREDDKIDDLCRQRLWECFRGDDIDVLNRYIHAGLYYKADIIVRITGDCPLISPDIVDKCVRKFLQYYPDIDYVSNIMPRTYPRGLDTEVISFSTLFREWLTAKEDREHVTLDLRKNIKHHRSQNISNDVDYSYMRLVVDNSEDLELIRHIYKQYGASMSKTPFIHWLDVVKYLEENKQWIIRDDPSIL